MVDITLGNSRWISVRRGRFFFWTWASCFATKLDSFQWPQLVSEIDKGLRQEKMPHSHPPPHHQSNKGRMELRLFLVVVIIIIITTDLTFCCCQIPTRPVTCLVAIWWHISCARPILFFGEFELQITGLLFWVKFLGFCRLLCFFGD